MTIQIKPSVTNPTIAEIYQSIEAGRLILRPDFQRKFVWTHDHQEEFIDTVLKGLPFPEIYVCEGDVDIKNLKTTKHVIDGQQRLTTIKRYIDGIHDKALFKITPYEQLTDEQKRQFLSYQVVVRDIGTVDDETVREIFRRINLTKFKLEDVEIHNAVYDGYFIKTAKNILENVSLENYGVFKESEFTRMADLHFMLLVMATLENEGYFAQDREVEKKVIEFNDEYPNKDHLTALLIKTFAVISDLQLPLDSIWFRKSNFFTLVVEIARHIKQLPNDLRTKLDSLEESILNNKNNSDSDFSRYYSYMYQATHGRTARVTRAEFFEKYIFS
jgi:uncharacterized protein with ParB-like and HNH nuclease domain